MARGKYIARQDCGDVSLPGRLRVQVDMAQNHPDAVMISCGTRFVGPQNEELYTVVQESDAGHAGLLQLEVNQIRGTFGNTGPISFPGAVQTGGRHREGLRVPGFILWVRLWTRPGLSCPKTIIWAVNALFPQG